MYLRQLKELAVLALPLVLAQLAQNTVSFVDTLMVGRLGNDALAGIALGSTVFFFVSVVLSGVILGVGPIVSQATGAGDEETCSRAVRQGLWLGLILFIPALILFWNIYPILIWMKQSPSTAEASSNYLRAISWGMLPNLWIFALRGFLEGKSNMKPIMLICFAGVAVNIFANDTLMFGRYGFPALGLVGTGYASTFVFCSVFLMLAVYITRVYASSNVFAGLKSPDASMMKEVLKVGGPIGFTLGFECSMFSAAAIAMGTLGENQLAAHQIALQTSSITFMIPLGLAIATSVLVGQAVGAGQIERAQVAGFVGIATCAGVMMFTGFILWTFPQAIIGLYLDTSDTANAGVVRFATGFLRIAAIFQLVDGIQVASSGALRGIKDTKAAMVLTLISYWGIGTVAGGYLCFVKELGGDGLWWGMTAGLAAASILLTGRFVYRVSLEKKLAAEKLASG